MECVYFFKSGDKIKIGKSKNVENRFNAIKTSCPDPVVNLGFLEVEDSSKLEMDLHELFGEKRSFGEWFEITDEEVEGILSSFDLETNNAGELIRNDYDGEFWNDVRKEYEENDITLVELARKRGIKLGTLKSRKSREGWTTKKVYSKTKFVNEVGETNHSELIITSLSIVMGDGDYMKRKAASKILDYLFPEWKSVMK